MEEHQQHGSEGVGTQAGKGNQLSHNRVVMSLVPGRNTVIKCEPEDLQCSTGRELNGAQLLFQILKARVLDNVRRESDPVSYSNSDQ